MLLHISDAFNEKGFFAMTKRKANCPKFAKIEFLADDIQRNLPFCHVEKIPIIPENWDQYVENIELQNGWALKKNSPIVWRELLDRGGKGLLIGDANDFQEYVYQLYGITAELPSSLLIDVSEDNLKQLERVIIQKDIKKSQIRPLIVTITHSNTPLMYHLVSYLLDKCFGNEELELRFLHSENNPVDALVMEVKDIACKKLRRAMSTTSLEEAFDNSDFILVTDEIEPIADVNDLTKRHYYLQQAKEICKNYADYIVKCAKSTCKILVAGQLPLNFTTYHFIQMCTPKLSRHNIAGAASFFEGIYKAQLANKLKVNPSKIENVLVWGGVTEFDSFVDVSRSQVRGAVGAITGGPSNFTRHVPPLIFDNQWLELDLHAQVAGRINVLKQALGAPPYAFYASTLARLISSWFCGRDNQFSYSLVVHNEDYYSMGSDLAISLPVKFHKGSWEVVVDIEISEEEQERIREVAKLLQDEIDLGEHLPTPPPTPGQVSLVKIDEEVEEETEAIQKDEDAENNLKVIHNDYNPEDPPEIQNSDPAVDNKAPQQDASESNNPNIENKDTNQVDEGFTESESKEITEQSVSDVQPN